MVYQRKIEGCDSLYNYESKREGKKVISKYLGKATSKAIIEYDLEKEIQDRKEDNIMNELKDRFKNPNIKRTKNKRGVVTITAKKSVKYNGWRHWGSGNDSYNMSKTEAEYKAKQIQEGMDETSSGKGYYKFRIHEISKGKDNWEVQSRNKVE